MRNRRRRGKENTKKEKREREREVGRVTEDIWLCFLPMLSLYYCMPLVCCLYSISFYSSLRFFPVIVQSIVHMLTVLMFSSLFFPLVLWFTIEKIEGHTVVQIGSRMMGNRRKQKKKMYRGRRIQDIRFCFLPILMAYSCMSPQRCL